MKKKFEIIDDVLIDTYHLIGIFNINVQKMLTCPLSLHERKEIWNTLYNEFSKSIFKNEKKLIKSLFPFYPVGSKK